MHCPKSGICIIKCVWELLLDFYLWSCIFSHLIFSLTCSHGKSRYVDMICHSVFLFTTTCPVRNFTLYRDIWNPVSQCVVNRLTELKTASAGSSYTKVIRWLRDLAVFWNFVFEERWIAQWLSITLHETETSDYVYGIHLMRITIIDKERLMKLIRKLHWMWFDNRLVGKVA